LIKKLKAKVFGTANEREVKRMQPRVERINALEPEIRKLSDAELVAKTEEFHWPTGQMPSRRGMEASRMCAMY